MPLYLKSFPGVEGHRAHFIVCAPFNIGTYWFLQVGYNLLCDHFRHLMVLETKEEKKMRKNKRAPY